MMNRFTIKKRMVLLVLLMVAALGVHAEENVILRLNTTGGQQYDFVLAGQQPEIVCRNSVMTVSYHEQDAPEKTVTLSFSRDEVDNLCFVSKTVDAIDQVSQQQRIGFNLSQSGKVLQGDFDASYFTEIDIRRVSQINLNSKKVE